MAVNQFLKTTQTASAALGLLQRDIVVPGLVWTNAAGDFAGAQGGTISLRVPARMNARTRQLRDNTSGLVLDTLAETKVDVSLTTDIYTGVPVTDENLTLDISDFGSQVLTPQVRAVAEGVENAVAAQMTSATYAATINLDTTDPFNTAVDARRALNKAFVPMSDRYMVIGADMEASFLKSPHFNRYDGAGDAAQSALQDAVLGRIKGCRSMSPWLCPATSGTTWWPAPATGPTTGPSPARRRSRLVRGQRFEPPLRLRRPAGP